MAEDYKMKHRTCPRCGQPLVEIPGKAIKCVTNKGKEDPGCGFIFWTTYMFTHKHTPQEIDDLLDGKKIIVSLKNKAGKPYKREIYLNENFEPTFDEPYIDEPQQGNFL